MQTTLPGRGTTGRSVTSASGTRSSPSGGSASRSAGVSAPSASTPRSGRTASPSTRPANRRPPSEQLAKRTGSAGGAQADVEVAGPERRVEPALGALVALQRAYERLLDGADRVVLEVRVVREEDLRDQRRVAVRRHLEVDVRGPPRMLADRLQVAAHRPLRRHRVRLGDHRLELVLARLGGAEAPAEVELGLALVPDVVAAVRPRLPDVDHRLR